MQLSSSITSQQYGDNIIAKSCKVADVYDESTLKGVFIELVDSSIRHSFRNNWTTHPEADLTEIAFQVESLLPIEKGSGNPSLDNQQQTSSKKLYTQKL